MAQLKAEKERADTAENQLDAVRADVAGLHEQNTQLKENLDAAEAREEEAWKMQSKAEARAKTAESQLEGSRQVAEAANRRADKWRSEAEAARKQPIVAVVDKDEVARQAKEMADGMTADWVHLPYEFLANVSNDIINKVKGVNRVVYDISSKPPATIEWE